MITQHQYLDAYPIPLDSKLLILGTIHPHNTENFLIPFFYGNRNSIWTILSDAFPGEIPMPVSLDGILAFLQKRNIAVSDTIRVCRRLSPTALDKDLIPEKLNLELIEQVRRTKIDRILCTSAFNKNNAFRLFYEQILQKKLTATIKASREVTLDKSVFGRPVQVRAIYSPSGSSNVPLSKLPIYQKAIHRYAGFNRPVYHFKVDYYRTQFTD